VKATSLKLSGQAGSPLTVALSLVGLQAAPLGAGAVLTALQGLSALSSKGYIYPEAAGQIKLNNVVSKIHSIDFRSTGTPRRTRPTTTSRPTSTWAAARRPSPSRRGSCRARSASSTTTRSSTARNTGTALNPAIGTQPFEVKFVRGANTSIDILLPAVSYAAIPVNPDPGGAPIEAQVACNVETPAAAQIVTVTVADQTLKATIL
jgi:hypothetical protein